MKIRLAILDSDTMYLERFIASFTKLYVDKIELYCFTDMNVAINTLEMNKIEVFIASSTFNIDTMSLPRKCGFAYFVDSSDIEMFKEERTICRFQKADLIYKEILAIFSEKVEDIAKIKIESDTTTNIVTFLPTSGGVGGSTMAVAAAKYLSRVGKRVLYINMEEYGDTDFLFDGEGSLGFSDVIYALKSKRSNLLLRLESIVRQDSSGTFYYASTKTAMDMIELTKEDLFSLIKELKLSGTYDYLILDANYSIKDTLKLMLSESTSIIMVSDGSEIATKKFVRLYNVLEILEEQMGVNILSKSRLLYNKYSNKTGQALSNDLMNVIGGVPRFEHATANQIIKQLVEMNLFEQLLAER